MTGDDRLPPVWDGRRRAPRRAPRRRVARGARELAGAAVRVYRDPGRRARRKPDDVSPAPRRGVPGRAARARHVSRARLHASRTPVSANSRSSRSSRTSCPIGRPSSRRARRSAPVSRGRCGNRPLRAGGADLPGARVGADSVLLAQRQRGVWVRTGASRARRSGRRRCRSTIPTSPPAAETVTRWARRVSARERGHAARAGQPGCRRHR